MRVQPHLLLVLVACGDEPPPPTSTATTSGTGTACEDLERIPLADVPQAHWPEGFDDAYDAFAGLAGPWTTPFDCEGDVRELGLSLAPDTERVLLQRRRDGGWDPACGFGLADLGVTLPTTDLGGDALEFEAQEVEVLIYADSGAAWVLGRWEGEGAPAPFFSIETDPEGITRLDLGWLEAPGGAPSVTCHADDAPEDTGTAP